MFSDHFIKVFYKTNFDWSQEWSFQTGLTENSSIHTLNTSNFRITQPKKVYRVFIKMITVRCAHLDTVQNIQHM